MPVEVSDIIKAAGGEIVGKIRLQKMVYLLDQLGLESGFSFDYHHYGPYSAELALNTDFDVVMNDVIEEPRRRASDGVPYSVFKLPPARASEVADEIGGIRSDVAKSALTLMQKQSGTVLELAATIHWLALIEEVDDWKKELIRRKGAKASAQRVEKALSVLRDLGVPPA